MRSAIRGLPVKKLKVIEGVRCSLAGRLILYSSCTGKKRRNKKPCGYHHPDHGCVYYTMDEATRLERKYLENRKKLEDEALKEFKEKGK